MDHCHVEGFTFILFRHKGFDCCDCPLVVWEEELFLVWEVGEAVVVEEGLAREAGVMHCVEDQQHRALSFHVSLVGEHQCFLLITRGRGEPRELELLARLLVVAVDLNGVFRQSQSAVEEEALY